MPDTSCNDPFLIVAGVAKAGTTSLFRYLAAHPGIAACRRKEPWFFLPPDVPFPTRPRVAFDPLSEYLAMFPTEKPAAVKLEASGNYFHYPDLAPVIARSLPNARIVVSLREPVRRLQSQFQMGQLRGWMPASVTFDEFVARMFELKPEQRAVPFSDWYMIDESLYAARLSRWLEVFGPDRLTTVWFDDLQRAPGKVAAQVAAFAGLDDAFFAGRTFRAENAALEDRVPWVRASLRRLRRVALGEELLALAEPLRRPFERWLRQPARPPAMSQRTRAQLEGFYRDDVVALAEVLGRAPPWLTHYVAVSRSR